MADPYPLNFEVEIDRDRLRQYLRAKWLLLWLVLFSFFGLVFGAATGERKINQGMRSPAEVLWLLSKDSAIGMGIGLGLAFVLYALFSHRRAAHYSKSLSLSVEGPFLRIRECLAAHTDRRLHFRAVVDYAIEQDWLMRRFGVETLKMRTTCGGPVATIVVPGLKAGITTRDLLSEVDRVRENAT